MRTSSVPLHFRYRAESQYVVYVGVDLREPNLPVKDIFTDVPTLRLMSHCVVGAASSLLPILSKYRQIRALKKVKMACFI